MIRFHPVTAIVCILAILIGGCATRTGTIPPKAVNAPVLDYPPEAILEMKSGTLLVLIHVDEDGSSSAFKVMQSTGSASLDSAGLEFLQRLEFLPAVIRGRKEASWGEQMVIFSLEKKPLDPLEWRDATGSLIHSLKKAAPGQQVAIQQQLYERCTDYLSSVITRPDLQMNRLALGLAAAPVREQWMPHTGTFPMSFLMFADFVARVQDPPLPERALSQLRQAVEVDIRRIDQLPAHDQDSRLSALRSSLVAYLDQLGQSNE